MGRGRQPLSGTQQVNREKLQHLLQCILADFGFVEPPAGGCPVRDTNPERQQVQDIASGVLQSLRERGLI